MKGSHFVQILGMLMMILQNSVKDGGMLSVTVIVMRNGIGELSSNPRQDFVLRLVGLGCRIQRLLLCIGVRSPPTKCPRYDTKQSDIEVPVMLELWGMQSTPSLSLLPGPLWPRLVASVKGPIYELNRTKP